MISMTGHGRGESRTATWTATIECFSVNRKTAEVVCHSERSAAWLEPIVRERVMSRIARGRVQVNLSLTPSSDSALSILDERRARAFVTQALALQKKLGLTEGLTLRDVLTAPGVTRSLEPADDGARSAALQALDRALDGLVATRLREGQHLARVLTRGISRLTTITKKIHPRARAASLVQRESLINKLHAIGLENIHHEPRFLTEIAILADRSDVTEEVDRARSHLEQFREKLSISGPVGRTLEFVAQELGREFNTIGSKSSDLGLSRLVIDAKAELEKIREQLANIE